MKKHLKCVYFAFIDIRMRKHHLLYLILTFEKKMKIWIFGQKNGRKTIICWKIRPIWKESMQWRPTRVLDLKIKDILDYFCTLFGALTPKTKNSDEGGGQAPVEIYTFDTFCCRIQ